MPWTRGNDNRLPVSVAGRSGHVPKAAGITSDSRGKGTRERPAEERRHHHLARTGGRPVRQADRAGAEITYEFDNLEVFIPSSATGDATHAKWKMNGILKIRTRDLGRN